MKTKSTLYLLGISILLAIYAFVFVYPSLSQDANSYILSNVNPTNISKIELSYNNIPVTIEKKQNIWYITQPTIYKADNDRIKSIIDSLSKLKTSIKITNNDRTKYGVNNTGTIILKMFNTSGQILSDIKIGNQYTTNNSFYVMNNNEIYVARINNPENLQYKEINELRDMKIINTINKEDISKIINNSNNTTFIRTSIDPEIIWIDINNKTVDTQKIHEYINIMFSTYIDKFANNTNILFDKNIHIYTDEDSKSPDIIIYLTELNKKYYIKTNLSDEVFEINKFYYDKMLQNPIDE